MDIGSALNGLFGQSSYLIINKNLVKHLGINATLIYSSLVQKYSYYKQYDKLIVKDNKEWFYSTVEDIEDSTTLSRYAQEPAIKKLEEAGLIEKKNFGLPASRHFHLVDTAEVIEQILEMVSLTSSGKNPHSYGGKTTSIDGEKPPQKLIYKINNKINIYPQTSFEEEKAEVEEQTGEGENTLLNNNEPNSSAETKSNSDSHIAKKEKECSDVPAAKPKRQKNNIPPTIEEVQQYVEQRIRDGDTIYKDVDVNYFYDYYQSSNWHYKDGKPVKFWRMCLATWVRNIGRYGGKEQVKEQEPTQERAPRKYQYVETDENTLVNGMTRAEYEKLYRPFEPFA